MFGGQNLAFPKIFGFFWKFLIFWKKKPFWKKKTVLKRFFFQAECPLKKRSRKYHDIRPVFCARAPNCCKFVYLDATAWSVLEGKNTVLAFSRLRPVGIYFHRRGVLDAVIAVEQGKVALNRKVRHLGALKFLLQTVIVLKLNFSRIFKVDFQSS